MSERADVYYTQLRELAGISLDRALMCIDRDNHGLCASHLNDAVNAVKSVTERMGREGTMTTLIEYVRDRAVELSKLSADLLTGNARGDRLQISQTIHNLYCGLFERF